MPSVAATVNDQEPREKAVIDVARQHTAPGVDASLLKIVAASKISPLKIMRDYLGLAFGPGKITFEDYTQLRLFDNAFWSGVNRRTVVGRAGSAAISLTINYRHDWWALAANKVASTSYLAAHGFPVIPILAIYCNNLKTATANVACNEQQLQKILTDESNYPMFGKPTDGVQSLGSVSLRRLVPEKKSFETHENREIPLDTFVEQLRTHYPAGYLFQKFVTPHAAIRALCGDRLATVRIVTLATETGPKVFRVCWKIPAGENAADNYWRKGNLLAKIDFDQGRVQRVLSGVGLDLLEHDRHPDTDVPLIDFQIPHWQRVLDTAIQAARLMQHIPLIGWDVAVLDQGPVIVEMNQAPDFFLPQLADGRGVLEAELTDFMAIQKRKFAVDKKSKALTFKT